MSVPSFAVSSARSAEEIPSVSVSLAAYISASTRWSVWESGGGGAGRIAAKEIFSCKPEELWYTHRKVFSENPEG